VTFNYYKGCRVDYYSDEEGSPTTSQVTLPELKQNSTSDNDKKQNSTSDNDYKQNSTSDNDGNKEANNTGNANNPGNTNNKGSLLDDYADVSCEMPDYMGGDD